ncbi:MAG: transglycosylase domain-containing protein [bacterium]|jgi:penicillin-binding protein 1A
MLKGTKGNITIPFLLFVLAFLVFAGSAMAFLAGCVKDMPRFDPEVLRKTSMTSSVFDAHGQLFTRLHAEENRLPVTLDQIPTHLRQAFIATEDVRFEQHYGVDLKAIARAAFRILTKQSFEGGSTITQQLVKNAFLTQEQTMKRKIQEAILALQVERRFTKDQILEMYLNEIYFNHGAYGVQAASKLYFGKDVWDLNLAESAMLTGITKNPSRYSPFVSMEAARTRQAIVLDNMVRAGYISESEATKAKSEEIHLAELKSRVHPAPYFVDYVISTLVKELAPKMGSESAVYDAIYRGGLEIHTTIDPTMQQAAEDALIANLPKGEEDSNGLIQPQGAIVAVDPNSGAVRAMVGGRNYEETKFNRAAQALRQPGSAFKPFVYTTALLEGWSPASVLDDAPVVYKDGSGKTWAPNNYNNTFQGLTTLRVAIEKSLNVVAVRLMEKVGVDQVVSTAEDMGLTTLVKSGSRNDRQLALALGGMTEGVSPLEMAAAYSVLANGGFKVDPHPVTLVRDANGNVLWENQSMKTEVLSPQVAYLMTDMLKGVITRGTGSGAASVKRPAAGKTGTTSENNDVWFVGYTPDLSAAVWIGSDAKPQGQRTYLSRHGIGSGLPARIWGAFMKQALTGTPVRDFSRPSGFVPITVCRKSGLLPGNLCPPEDLVTDYFIKGTEPAIPCDVHVTATVCSETGELATEYCPAPITKVFIQRKEPYAQRADGKKPADAHLEVPTTTCTMHTTPPITPLFPEQPVFPHPEPGAEPDNETEQQDDNPVPPVTLNNVPDGLLQQVD